MVEVELKDLLVQFQGKLNECFLEHELHGIESVEDLKDNLEAMIAGLESRAAMTISLEEHPIDKFGLATLAAQLINANTTNKQVAEILTSNSNIAFTAKEVQQWKDNYSHLSYDKKKAEEKRNVFDIQNRLQDLYSMVYDHLQLIKDSQPEDFWKAKTSQQQVMLDAMKELRMISADAVKVINMVSHQERLSNFMQIVYETVNQIDPATANTILTKLKQNKALISALTPASN